MKSNICVVEKGGLGLENILWEVEKVTKYNEMPEKEALRLRLLAEDGPELRDDAPKLQFP